MDLTNLENALKQVYRSLEGIYQISKVLNRLDLLKKFSDHDIVGRIQTIKNALVGYEARGQELKAKINDLMDSLEAKKQELKARLSMELQSAVNSEVKKLNDAGNELKTKPTSELTPAKNNLLADYEAREQELKAKINDLMGSLEARERELKAKINDLMDSLEAKKQELEARLSMELQSAVNSEVKKLNDAGNELKTKLISELTPAKNNLAQESEQQIRGVTKFLGIYVYGAYKLFQNPSDEFMKLFEFSSSHLQANKSYIVEFSMPYILEIDDTNTGEMVLCLKANSKVWPIVNSFYQNRTIALFSNNKVIEVYRTTCVFETPNEQADYKIAVFSRRHKKLWVNVTYDNNTVSFETSFLNSANFRSFTTQSIAGTYNNNIGHYKRSQAIIYEIL